MKKILGLLLVSLIMTACNTTKFSTGGEKEKKFVDDFLNMMDKDHGPDYTGLMACISPAYLKENNLNPEKYKVDNYSVWGHSIESYTSRGTVVTRIWGENHSWEHELTFQLRKEGGKLYLVPSEHDQNYLSPWSARRTYLKAD